MTNSYVSEGYGSTTNQDSEGFSGVSKKLPLVRDGDGETVIEELPRFLKLGCTDGQSLGQKTSHLL